MLPALAPMAASAAAEWPFLTEDAANLSEGRSSLSLGVGRQRDARFYAGVLGWQWGHWRCDGTLRSGIHDCESRANWRG